VAAALVILLVAIAVLPAVMVAMALALPGVPHARPPRHRRQLHANSVGSHRFARTTRAYIRPRA